MKQKFNVTGMTCSACSAHVEKSVSAVKGVQGVVVSLLTNSMTVDFDQSVTNADEIVRAVQKGGYGASVADGKTSQNVKKEQNQNTVGLSRLLVSIGFCVVLMYVSMGAMVRLPLPSFLDGHENAVSFALVQLLLCLPVWYVNRNYFIVGFKRLFKGSPNMDSLIAVGSAAGAVYAIAVTFVISNALGQWATASTPELAEQYMSVVKTYHHQLYFESSAMILALVDLGKYFEGRSKNKTGDALRKLRNLAPAKAILLVNGEQTEVDSSSIKVGDTVVVKAGMAFPADGVVRSGSCFADESAISGESMPVEKLTDSTIIGGTKNVGGYVVVEVTSAGQDSVLSKIITLVEDASSSKAPIQRLADKISSVFVPVMMSISLITFVVWLCVGEPLSVALNFAISVLVISCPCALGLATPVAIMVSTGKAASNGILVKNGETLEKLSQVKYVALDKTGTVTVGKPQVKQFFSVADEQEFFAVTGGIEKQSEHPLGKAVVDYAEQKGIALSVAENMQTIAGMGVVATVNGVSYAIGNKRLMDEQGVDANGYDDRLSQMSSQALTCLVVSKNGKFWGIIGVGDEIKQTSRQAVAEMKALGLTPVLITGDNALSAKAVCDELGIDKFFAEVLPQQKEQHVAELMKDGQTAMVGDGINDAPALARADVGIAVANGSDIAVDSADAVLVKNDVRDVATAVALSRKTVRNIKQNLFWAFFYNALGIPVAAGALYHTALHLQLSPMIAAAAMSLSSLFVVTNALRLNFFKAPKELEQFAQQNGVSDTTKTTLTTQSVTQEDQNNGVCNNNSVCKENDEMKIQLSIEGMMCGHCTARVEKTLRAVSGVTDVFVSLENKNAIVTGNGLDGKALASAVSEQGYEVKEIKQL